jgi:hypothetical protein
MYQTILPQQFHAIQARHMHIEHSRFIAAAKQAIKRHFAIVYGINIVTGRLKNLAQDQSIRFIVVGNQYAWPGFRPTTPSPRFHAHNT